MGFLAVTAFLCALTIGKKDGVEKQSVMALSRITPRFQGEKERGVCH
jgi:hypothetical protein